MPQPRHYLAAADWTQPELATIDTELRVDHETTTATTTHFDTEDRALGRHGVAVSVGPGGCSVRLPEGEFTTSAPSTRAVPRDVQTMLVGVRGGKRLVPIARTESVRAITRLMAPDDEVRATIVDDQTTATAFHSADVVHRQREITLTTSDKSLRSALHKALITSGATRRPPDHASADFVVPLTSLGSAAHAPCPAAGTVGRLLADYLDEQHTAILRTDVALRRGADVVHAARVATRRYRSALRVFGDLVDADRAAALEVELQWYAEQLGTVRDLQVQRDRLHQAVAELAPELVLGPVLARIDQTLHGEALAARDRIDRAMRGHRYLALLAELDAWQHELPVTDRARLRAVKAGTYVEHAGRVLARRLRAAARPGAADEVVHRARRAAKRARYAAELAEPALGKHARRRAARAKKLQTRLGEFVDIAVTGPVLLRLAAATAKVPNENGFTFGLLYEAERARAAQIRAKALPSAR
jgi:CHAD domain-containing protein